MYVDTGYGLKGMRVVMWTPTHQSYNASCLTFYYDLTYNNETGTASLSLYQQSTQIPLFGSQLWSTTTTGTFTASVTIPGIPEAYSLAFVGTLASPVSTSIAITHVELVPGMCMQDQYWQCTDQFSCASRQCVETSQTCDGNYDCLDEADEITPCGKHYHIVVFILYMMYLKII